ncbi:hypothetical protein NA57DRAFT_81476 [Rhizodiscina lignyota]|uniref:F-box domain-containing protein n=1 Tax=Rhizodiscina lignyota TaxID=1504668 RepID=A0A9P4I7F3_9PEZI|nr:hypothetical protein NA57DRAFT_81476 [Rhizodiscina lignyota]
MCCFHGPGSSVERGQPQSRLMMLPAELRSTIYELVFEPVDMTVHSFTAETASSRMAFLATCKQVYYDARRVAYANGTFVLDGNDEKSQHKLYNLTHWQLGAVKSVLIQVDHLCGRDSPDANLIGKHFFPPGLNLEQVTIKPKTDDLRMYMRGQAGKMKKSIEAHAAHMCHLPDSTKRLVFLDLWPSVRLGDGEEFQDVLRTLLCTPEWENHRNIGWSTAPSDVAFRKTPTVHGKRASVLCV